MSIQVENRNQVLVYGLPILIILFSVCLALSPLLVRLPALAMGITYDLTLTAPLVYFLLIRKKSIPKVTVLPFFVLGIILAAFFLPEHQQYHLGLVTTYLLPVVELTALSVIAYHVYKTVNTFKEKSAQTKDFYSILKESAIQALGHAGIAKVFATEIAMLYYTFFAWKKEQEPVNGFSNFKENGIVALLAAIVMMVIVETFIVHLLVAKWNEMVAWMLSVASLYAAIQITGHLKALKRRYAELKGNHLLLKYGLFGDITIELNTISRIELASDNIKGQGLKVEKLALLKDIESHNVAIYFNQKQKVEKAYGMTRECDVVLLHIDNKKEFLKTINNALQQGT